MKHSVESIARAIVEREGGYVNDPADPGGPTKYGVTVGTLRRLGIDKNGDGRVDAADVKLLGIDDAVEIFKTHYFQLPKIYKLPAPLQPTVFDMQVNAGANAVKLLQRMLNKMKGTGPTLTDDGKIGPITLRAVDLVHKEIGPQIADIYGIERRNYYYALADRRPAMRKFARRKDGGKGGWILRAEEFLSERYHLTEAEHRARVAKWG